MLRRLLRAAGLAAWALVLLVVFGLTAYLAFNQWIRASGVLDGVVDFDQALRDPEHPTQMLPRYDCGDGLHPSDLGYCTMGDAIDLALFD